MKKIYVGAIATILSFALFTNASASTYSITINYSNWFSKFAFQNGVNGSNCYSSDIFGSWPYATQDDYCGGYDFTVGYFSDVWLTTTANIVNGQCSIQTIFLPGDPASPFRIEISSIYDSGWQYPSGTSHTSPLLPVNWSYGTTVHFSRAGNPRNVRAQLSSFVINCTSGVAGTPTPAALLTREALGDGVWNTPTPIPAPPGGGLFGFGDFVATPLPVPTAALISMPAMDRTAQVAIANSIILSYQVANSQNLNIGALATFIAALIPISLLWRAVMIRIGGGRGGGGIISQFVETNNNLKRRLDKRGR